MPRRLTVLCQSAIERRSCSECHIRTQIVFPFSTSHASPAWHSRFHSHAVPDLQALHAIANVRDDPTRLVAKHHRRLDNELPNGSMDPVMDIGAADSSEFRVDNDIVGRYQLRYWSVFELDAPSFLEDERQILDFLFSPCPFPWPTH